MALESILNTKKLIYILIAIVAFLVLITFVIIIRNVGSKQGQLQASLEFWGVYDTKQDFAKVIRSFQQTEPGIKINYKQFSYEDYEKALIGALAAGTGPDLVMIHHTWLAKHKDKLSSMPATSGSEEIKFMAPVSFENEFVEVAYKDLVSDGKIYAIPLYIDTLALYYNRDMFNTAGITKPPEDWKQFNEAVKLLTKLDENGDIIQAGAAIGTAENINRSTDILAALMIQNGTQMNNPNGTTVAFTRSVNFERVGENALEYYTDFANPAKEVYAWNDLQHYSIDAFVEGKVAMMFNYSHQVSLIRKRYDRLNFSVAPMPQVNPLNAKNYANYFAVGVSAQSKSKNAAWRFLNFLASRDGSTVYLTETSRPAARRDLIDLQRNDPRLGVFVVQALSAKSWFQVDNDAIGQIFADMIEEVNSKKTTVRAALRAAESKVNTLMSRRAQ